MNKSISDIDYGSFLSIRFLGFKEKKDKKLYEDLVKYVENDKYFDGAAEDVNSQGDPMYFIFIKVAVHKPDLDYIEDKNDKQHKRVMEAKTANRELMDMLKRTLTHIFKVHLKDKANIVLQADKNIIQIFKSKTKK